MDGAIANPHHPNLRLGNAGARPFAFPQLIGINLVNSAFNVDSCKLAPIVGLELGTFILTYPLLESSLLEPRQARYTSSETPSIPAGRALALNHLAHG